MQLVTNRRGGSPASYVGLLLSCMLFLLILPTNASRGDQLPEFRDCVERCVRTECPATLPLHLRLTFWNCPQNCDYNCQQTITAGRLRDGLSVEQFHGKWPFRRLLGVQEPFSVLFSILNGYAHYTGLRHLNQHLPPRYPMASWYRLFAYFGFACWFWSAVFHTRDFIFTERMDYFGAGANVLYGLYYAPIRLFRLYKPAHRRNLSVWKTACIVAYLGHVYFLQFIRWDYTYNMAANVVAGAISNILWSYYSFKNYADSKKGGNWWKIWPGLIVTWLVAAMSLELLDFPPVMGLDAHALWHAATIGPTYWWYRFLVRDAIADSDMPDGGEKVMTK